MSRPIVVIVCMFGSFESWEPQQAPHRCHSRAGGGAVHSIKSGLRRCSISAEPHRSSAVTQKPRRTNFSLRWRLGQGPPQKETPSLVRTRVGVGDFVASLRLLSWAARIQGGLSYAII